MIRIRRVYSSALPADRHSIEQAQAVFRLHFTDHLDVIDGIPDLLDQPFRYGYRTVLLVSEKARRAVTGASLVLHFPEVNSSFLDFIAVPSRTLGGGSGSALFEATREQLQQLGSRGMYLETLSDDPREVPNPSTLQQNRQRLRFYEQYGLRPVIGTDYEKPVGDLPAGPLLFDGLGRKVPLGSTEARAAVRCILQRKHRDSLNAADIERIVRSFRNDPVQFRPPQYVQSAKQPHEVTSHRLEPAFALVSPKGHEVHLVHQRGYVERPARIGAIMEGLSPLGLFREVAPRRFGEGAIREVHDGNFVNYLKAVCRKLNTTHPVYPYVFPIRRPESRPKDLAVRAGYYCVDTFTPLDRNAYQAARGAVSVALTATAELLSGRRVVYALCRPPGHHAGRRTFGGFCYFNNAAIAAHRLSKWGKVATLDIDYHHGNGTQDIFYERDDVLTVSLHGQPSIAYPHFSGFADERGEARGRGYNRNFPLPERTGQEPYLEAFSKAMDLIARFKPEFLVLSLGLDLLKGDPTGSFVVPVKALSKIGTNLGALGLPLLVVQEGGYSLRNLRRGAPALFLGIQQGLREAPRRGRGVATRR